MKNNLFFDDVLIMDFYLKRQQLNKLKQDIDKKTEEIKHQLLKNQMLYSGTKNFSIVLNPKHRPTKDFLHLMETNNLSYLIYKHCYKENFLKACEILNINDYKSYQELWYYTLNIHKK